VTRSKLWIRIESLQIGGWVAKEFETRQLGRSGVHVTVLGFGGGPVGTFINSEADAIACDTIDSAWDEGIRYFDTAPLYGLNRSERRVGNALADRPRDEFIVSTKVGRLIRTGGKPAPEQDPSSALGVIFDYSRHGTLASFEESLGRLNLRRVDVLLIHDIDHWTHGDRQSEAFAAALEGAYPVLADLKAKGRVRAIGLGVNEWQVCRDFANRAEIDCVLLAGRFTLLEQEPAREFLPFCLERGIGVIVGGPFNSGILATGPVAGALYNYAPAPPEIVERVRRIAVVADRYGFPLPAAALAFPLRHPAIACVIPGMASRAEVAAASAALRRPIPNDLWAELGAEGLVDMSP
jgi:D-threo-aldose 1-dehydrogenase